MYMATCTTLILQFDAGTVAEYLEIVDLNYSVPLQHSPLES